MPTRPALIALALSATLLTACAAGSETVPDPATPVANPTTGADPATQAPSSAVPAPAVSTPAEASPAVRVITASFAGGEVTVEQPRVQTALNEQVVLRISSDVPEEIHVHGYDVYADVPAGGSVDIPLTLTLPGAYEVELHEAGRPMFQLRTA